MAGRDPRTLGNDAEQVAAEFLASHGARPIDRNFRCRLGEIDIVASDGDCLAFVEVRFRGPGSLSAAGPTVDTRKQRKLVRTAALYVVRNPRFAQRVMRFDVIAIDADRSGQRTIRWIKDAFRPAGTQL